jgi:tetratricopeptide (TPR) repeat protein
LKSLLDRFDRQELRRARNLLDKARRDLRQNQAVDALAACREAARLCPSWEYPWFVLAETLASLDRRAELLDSYRFVATTWPRDSVLQAAYADAFYQVGDWQRARDAYSVSATLEPNEVRVWIGLCRALHQIGDHGDVLEVLSRAVRQHPRSAAAWTALGVEQVSQGQREVALGSLRSAIEVEPDRIQSYEHLGGVLLELGRVDDALVVYRSCVERDPVDPARQYNLGTAFLNAGRLAEAEQALVRASILDPSHAETWYNLGKLRTEQGRFPEAASCYRRSRKLKWTSDAIAEESTALESAGRLPEAIDLLRTSVRKEPHESGLREMLVRALLSYGRAADALSIIEEAEGGVRDARLMLLKGRALSEVGQYRNALSCFEGAQLLGADTFEVLVGTGNALVALGRLAEAEVQFRKAVEERPEEVVAHANLGFTVGSLGRWGEAEPSLRRAIALDSHDPELHGYLAECLARQGRHKEATTEMKTALGLDSRYFEGMPEHRVLWDKLSRTGSTVGGGKATPRPRDSEK